LIASIFSYNCLRFVVVVLVTLSRHSIVSVVTGIAVEMVLQELEALI
jgi:hypothetical protein